MISENRSAGEKSAGCMNELMHNGPCQLMAFYGAPLADLCQNPPMSGQGSTGNVIAALASFFIPGLGQLIQGRVFMALVMFVLAGILWFVWLGWIIHLWSIIDAAKYRGPGW